MKKPAVSIGLPVYNGEAFIEQALASLVRQTYRDIEIIISDNASNDKTFEICQAYSDKHDSIKFFHNAENRGVAWNFNNTFHLSCGKYFMWFAHDDVLHDRYIQRCVEELEARNNTCIVYSEIQVIDAVGNTLAFDGDLMDLNIDNIAVRFRRCLSPQPYNQSVIYGLMRRSVLANTTLHGDHIASDRCLVAQLALRGKFYRIPECLFYRRKHSGNFVADTESINSHLPNRSKVFVFPEWNVLRQHIRSVRVFKAPSAVKYRLYKEIAWWSVCRIKKLIIEILLSIRQLLRVVANWIRK